MQNYKELKVWEKSHKIVLDVYKITSNFPKQEVFGLTSQLRRASVSMPSNIAEGCGRYTQGDLARFLQISLGSSNETDYLLYLSQELEFIDNMKYKELDEKINEIRAMLISLISKVREKS